VNVVTAIPDVFMMVGPMTKSGQCAPAAALSPTKFSITILRM
jgi:hypothetical protein